MCTSCAQVQDRDPDAEMKRNLEKPSSSQSKAEDVDDAKRAKLEGNSLSFPKCTVQGGTHAELSRQEEPNEREASAGGEENPSQGPVCDMAEPIVISDDDEEGEEEEDTDTFISNRIQHWAQDQQYYQDCYEEHRSGNHQPSREPQCSWANNELNSSQGPVCIAASSEPIVISDSEEEGEEEKDTDIETFIRWVRNQQYYQARNEEQHSGDHQPPREAHCSWASNVPNSPCHDQPREEYNSEHDHLGHRDYYEEEPNEREASAGGEENPSQGPVCDTAEPIVISDDDEEGEEEEDTDTFISNRIKRWVQDQQYYQDWYEEHPSEDHQPSGEPQCSWANNELNSSQGPVCIMASSEPIVISDTEEEGEEKEDSNADSFNIFYRVERWMREREKYQPWYMVPHSGELPPGEPHCSWANNETSTSSRKRPCEQDSSDQDHRYDRDSKRRRLEECMSHSDHQQDFRQMSDPRPAVSYQSQESSGHDHSFHPEEATNDEQVLPPPQSECSSPVSYHSQGPSGHDHSFHPESPNDDKQMLPSPKSEASYASASTVLYPF